MSKTYYTGRLTVNEFCKMVITVVGTFWLIAVITCFGFAMCTGFLTWAGVLK